MFHKLNQPIETEGKVVTYLGAEILIDATHNWVAVIQLGSAGLHRSLLASFATKPAFNGVQYVPVDEGFAILGQVADVAEADLVNTLRQVDGDMSPVDAVINNAEELVIKMQHILENADSKEEAIHKIFCPEHGVLPEFFEYTGDALSEMFDEPSEDTSEEVPTDVKSSLLDAVQNFVQGMGDSSEKPRIRVVSGAELGELLDSIRKGKK